MVKSSFVKHRFNANFKKLIDSFYFFSFLFFSFIISIVNIFVSNNRWSQYFKHYAATQTGSVTLNFLQMSGLFIYCLLNMLIPAIIFRICFGMILPRTQDGIQRFFSFLVSIIYFFVCANFTFKFGYNFEGYFLSTEFISFATWLFLLVSLAFHFMNIRAVSIGEFSKYIFVLFFIAVILFSDFALNYFERNNIKKSISGSEIVFLFKNKSKNSESTRNEPTLKYITEKYHLNYNRVKTNLQEILDGYLKAQPRAVLSNIGNPADLQLSYKNIRGTTCPVDPDSLFQYYSYSYFLPIFNFFPDSLLLNYFPNFYCLYLNTDYHSVILKDIYKNIISKQPGQNKTMLYVTDTDIYQKDVKAVLQNFEIIYESFLIHNNSIDKNNKLKLKLYFIDKSATGEEEWSVYEEDQPSA